MKYKASAAVEIDSEKETTIDELDSDSDEEIESALKEVLNERNRVASISSSSEQQTSSSNDNDYGTD